VFWFDFGPCSHAKTGGSAQGSNQAWLGWKRAGGARCSLGSEICAKGAGSSGGARLTFKDLPQHKFWKIFGSFLKKNRLLLFTLHI
jgi:hypothetical protein